MELCLLIGDLCPPISVEVKLWRFMGFPRPAFSVEVELCWLMGALCPPTSVEVKLWQFMGETLPPVSVLNPILFNDGNFKNIILLFTHPK